MPNETSGPVFVLDVATDADAGIVRLRLTNEHGNHLGDNQVHLPPFHPWEKGGRGWSLIQEFLSDRWLSLER